MHVMHRNVHISWLYQKLATRPWTKHCNSRQMKHYCVNEVISDIGHSIAKQKSTVCYHFECQCVSFHSRSQC